MSPRRPVSMLSAVLATATLLLFAAAAPVSAGAPIGSGKVVSVARAPAAYPTEPFLLQAPGGFNPCGFPVSLQVTQAERSTTTITRADGTKTYHESGLLKVRLTRVGTSQSIVLDISGPGTVVVHPDGSITQFALGKQLWAFEADESHGLPLMTFLTGTSTSTFDTSGEFELLTWHGAVTDVCAALSGA